MPEGSRNLLLCVLFRQPNLGFCHLPPQVLTHPAKKGVRDQYTYKHLRKFPRGLVPAHRRHRVIFMSIGTPARLTRYEYRSH